MRNKLGAILLISLLSCLGCEDEYYGPTDGGEDPSADFIETEVSLSSDREYIYFISRDTIFDQFSGINRARISQPIRERIRAGENYHSPTINFDNNVLAYLYDGRIHYYNIALDSLENSGVIGEFESILYINENLLIAARNDSIFRINEEDSSYSYIRDGWDPTLVAADTFLIFASLDNYTFRIIRDNIEESHPETLYTIITEAYPHWPTLDPSSGHLAYGIEFWDQKFIYSGIAGESPLPDEPLIFIDSSEYSKPYILNSNQIIFSGPSGSLYQSDFEGNKSVPFIYAGE